VNPCGRLAALLAALALAACASVPRGENPIVGDNFSGRMSVRVDAANGVPARSENAAFELIGTPQVGRLNLSTPLGSVVAQARWDSQSVVLATPQGEQQFADLDALTQQILGESVPIAALFDWLKGKPWDGAANTPSTAPTERGFEQLGWVVSLARFDEGWVTARRSLAPAVTVRAHLDQP
jgi:outer membrane lipoprotein LolB